jgi:hypothetical protein
MAKWTEQTHAIAAQCVNVGVNATGEGRVVGLRNSQVLCGILLLPTPPAPPVSTTTGELVSNKGYRGLSISIDQVDKDR